MDDTAFTHDVFLSHSAKDKALVRAVAERLVAVRKHLKAWFDECEITKAEATKRKSASELQPSAFSLQPLLRAFGSDWAQMACPAVASRRRRKAGTFRFRDPLNKERRFNPQHQMRDEPRMKSRDSSWNPVRTRYHLSALND